MRMDFGENSGVRQATVASERVVHPRGSCHYTRCGKENTDKREPASVSYDNRGVRENDGRT